MSDSAVPGFINYPTPRSLEVPYKAPPPPSNPVIRGLPLYYGASIVAALPSLQTYLWNNAGFSVLRGLRELNDVENRYDPTVIPLKQPTDEAPHTYTNPQNLRVLPQDVAFRFYSVADFHNAYKSGKLTPTDVVESLLPLIRRDAQTPTKHSTAFLETRVDIVTKAAEAATTRWKEGRPLGVLDGVPVAVKDEMDLKGYKRCNGTLRDYTSKRDATSWCVVKLEEEGAVVLGKLNMHELGMDTTNNNPNHGTPLNPYNENYYTGGSSGGAAYAVGAGLIPFAIGTDGGGSIRIPSSFCGVYGLKPSHGRVSSSPSPSIANTTVVLGPLAGNMADLEVSYQVMANPNPANPSSSVFSPPKAHSNKRKKLLGIYKTWFNRADPLVRAACEKALDYFTSKLGYEIVDITLPFIHEGQLAHAMTILAEVAVTVPDVTGLTAANKVLIKVGSKTPTPDFLLAQKLRTVIMEHLAYLFQKHPGLIIVTPTSPIPGWHISGGKADLKYGCSDGNMTVRNMEYVWLANFTGIPCIQFPVGYVDSVAGTGKIPIGLSGNGEWGSEDALIEFGYDGEAWVNSGLEGGRRKPETWVDVLKLKEEPGVM
ncbi:glutamyl-tRNA amidotransferas-like protein subunit A [Mytilinidion resinicola]|uniref:Glutamyl-tRNA amidotransferas-like protein subunit A n=1 Tax=Mytilinidion resinicola TaxID=574789 RepID=A0A6A6YHU6_9PEZI|nr:glutamyl-tRNA amidotransferas-like protein subunit A [Mytilinidion resinicola]KAF2808149.1 glutamyl-tRNA amidotransferas-like protein subunit A [Mytilinidion resinicola]